MLKKIIVPTDGSEHANKAIDLAADLAQKYGAEIIVLHIMLRNQSVFDLHALAQSLSAEPSLIEQLNDLCDASVSAAASAYEAVVSIPASDDLLQALGEEICANACARVNSKSASDVRSYVVDGAPADRILMAADHEDADMIVMGSRGLGKVADLFMGSVSHRVNHMAECTCVTVK